MEATQSTETPTQARFLSVPELAQRLSISRSFAYSLVRDPESSLPVMVVSRDKRGRATVVRIPVAALEVWEQAQTGGEK